ncbi:hypothetical protein [Hansschlegelia sp. KR7-227]|jgi:hypothetical protein|uniref:hypothetical protein n=1 Tax=Hansschlegelia sp. KR7-227 TaxID=3400914 RepID=UPI003C0376E7
MIHEQSVDLSKLIGFDQISEDLHGEVDFRADAVGSKLGAKRGAEPAAVPADEGRDAIG